MVRRSTQSHQLVRTEADGLVTTPIRKWALDKYKLVSLYSHLFSTGMKNKWKIRVYSDLFAGSGFAQLKGTDQIYHGSPLLALGVDDPFNRYVFCERDEASLESLEQRTKRLFPNADAHYVAGDCNEKVNEVMKWIPSGDSVLSLCFVDPFDLSIKFSTIRRIANRRTDFLFVLALHMDGNRNASYYARTENRKIDDFLGLPEWRTEWWKVEATERISFAHFLADMFSKQMQSLGYLPVPFHKMKQIRSDLNLPLYHLALFSKSNTAFEFWDQVLRYGTLQPDLEFM